MTNMISLTPFLLLSLVLLSNEANAFTNVGQRVRISRVETSNLMTVSHPCRGLVVVSMSSAAPPPPPPPESDGQPPREELEEYTGDIDWDAEWKKVVRNQNQPAERPGKDYYKSEAEIAAIRAANAANKQVSNAVSGIPTWRALKGDWKFWIGVIALVSVGLSVLSANNPSSSTSIGSSDSYYI
jgi:hypothetical protein